MKYRILAVIVILAALFSININAADYEYTISPGDNFTSVQYGDDLTEISQKLNMDIDDLNTYFNKNGLIYLAVSADAKTQIRLSAFTDNFSSAVSDIAHLDDEVLNEFMNAVSDDDENSCEIVVNNNRKYIVVKNTLQDSGGTYTVTQYITICNSKTFYLSCYNNGEDTSSEINSIFENFKLNALQTEQAAPNLIFILISFGALIFAVVAVIMIIGIVKINRNEHNKT